MRRILSFISPSVVAAALAFAGCSGGGSTLPSIASAPNAAFGGGIPSRDAVPHGARVVQFAIETGAGAPGSMEVSISRIGGVTPVDVRTVDLTSRSHGCTKTQCIAQFALPAWNYAATIDTYADVNRGGKELSANQVFPFAVGSSNETLGFTFSGALASVAVAPGALGVTGSQLAGYTFDGVRLLPMEVVGLDSGHRAIVGVGAPHLSAKITGAGWRLSDSFKAAPNTVLVASPPHKGATATLDVTAVQGKRTVHAAVKLDNHLQTLMAFEGTLGIVMFAPPYTGTPTSNTNGVCGEPLTAAFDGASNLYVSAACQNAGSEEIVRFAPPYNGAPAATMGQGTLGPAGDSSLMAVNARGDVFGVPLAHFNYDVAEFEPPYTAPPVSIGTGTVYPTAFAIDARDDLFVQSSGAGSAGPAVVEFAPPYTGTPIATITAGMPRGSAMALDPAGNLFVWGSTNSGYVVAEYAPPYKSGPVAEFTNGVMPNVASMSVDAAGNVFLFTPSGGLVSIYGAPYTSSPITISITDSQLKSMTLDRTGALYLGHYYNSGPASSTITVTAPPFKGAAFLTITKGLQFATNAYGPAWLSLTP